MTHVRNVSCIGVLIAAAAFPAGCSTQQSDSVTTRNSGGETTGATSEALSKSNELTIETSATAMMHPVAETIGTTTLVAWADNRSAAIPHAERRAEAVRRSPAHAPSSQTRMILSRVTAQTPAMLPAIVRKRTGKRVVVRAIARAEIASTESAATARAGRVAIAAT